MIKSAIICVLILMLVASVAYTMKSKQTLEKFSSLIGNDFAQESRQLRPYNQTTLRAEKTLVKYRKDIDNLISAASGEFKLAGKQSKLSDACIYALQGGKRIRSIILAEIARLGKFPVDPAEAMLFCEYIHASSLVVDDLPEFDNDLVRRGNESAHVKFGPAVAKMAATSLFAAALQCMTRQINWIRINIKDFRHIDRVSTFIGGEIGNSLGVNGASGGQYMDISDHSEFGDDATLELIKKKTATFFETAVVIGYLISGGEYSDISIIRTIGQSVGTAFQIADDIGDMEKDAKNPKNWNFAIQYGKETAEIEMEKNLSSARLLLKQKSLWSPLWENEIYPMVRAMAKPN